MDQGLEIASIVSQTPTQFCPLECRQDEGETAAPAILSTPNRLKAAVREKLAGLLNRLPPRPTSFYTHGGSTLEIFNWPATVAVYAAWHFKVKR